MIGRFRELLRLDPDSGELFWKVHRGPVKAGDTAGGVSRGGYRRVKVDGRFYLAHRVIFAIYYGWLPDYVDHKDGDVSNNRPRNLRPSSAKQNQYNRKGEARPLPKGVYPRGDGRYVAKIRYNGRQVHIGSFATIQEAHAAYEEKADEVQGPFALHNSRNKEKKA
jgi:hypothetical protein